MNARTGAAPRYLDVRYSQSQRPLSGYPVVLAEYLSQTYLQDYRGGTLLDLGCGRGEFLRAFEECGFRGFGVDREVTTLYSFERPVRTADLENEALPFDDDSMDVLFNKSVLEHVAGITPLLRECQRVLRPGGIMISMVPDFRAQWSHFYDDWTHVRPFTLTGLRECLLSHDFDVLEARRFRQLPLLWRRPYLRPLADAASCLPKSMKTFKWVRFSKEWMLLAVARKPGPL